MADEQSAVWSVDPVTGNVHRVDNELSLRFDRHSPESVVFAGCLLRTKGLPTSSINHILFMAGLWLDFADEIHDEVEEEAPLDQEYLRLVVPGYMGHGALELIRCVAVTIDCCSHDQGWADTSDANGTYRGTNSWIEFDVLDATNKQVFPRTTVCRNLRATPSYRHHVMISRDSELLNFMVTPNYALVVSLRAQYGGWANYAKFTRISLAYVVGLRDYSIVQAQKTLDSLVADHGKKAWWGPAAVAP
ncbi:Aste57867_22433 [Aphanomyces stellatus]|uniref:Aste57867_22433 protein n=1 Tax=Aphanomyces stellatus TaxID=120398 RepID=A0A485LK92_9STRA|nr:hypothetical protein As57867_022363 [Aphanomyces stellatus]VFT99095.1 Aste57867_22433 [Aphanomyces stellatus]